MIGELEKLGSKPLLLPWTEGLSKVGPRDTVVIRAIWDYHLRADEFVRWLDAVAKIGCHVINPVALLRWNYRKSYLGEMARVGVRLPQTFFYASPADFAQNPPQLAEHHQYVLKPLISASAHGTFKLRAIEVAEAIQRHPYKGFLIQEFVPEIRDGEWSLIFIGGEFTHAVCKVPAGQDFRVQIEFGGRVVAQAPPLAARSAAERVISLLPGCPIYARVDFVMRHEVPLLMEIELIEPDLFLSTCPPAAARLANLITP